MPQQSMARGVRGEEHSEVHWTLGPSFWVGNCSFEVSLNSDVRTFQSPQGLHRKVTESESHILATLLPSALE